MPIGKLVVALTCLLPFGGTNEAHSLLPRVKVGDRLVYDYRSKVSVSGKEGEFRARFEMTIASLEPNRTITFRTEQKNGEYIMAGQTQKVPDGSTVTKSKWNGEMLSSEPPIRSAEQLRFSRLLWIVVPEKKAEVGTTWTWKSAANDENGKVELQGKGECLGFELKDGMRCAKLRLVAKEVQGDRPASVTTDVWVSLEDGMPVQAEMEFFNAPLGPGAAGNGRGVNRRVIPA